jgi:hypothetical protein
MVPYSAFIKALTPEQKKAFLKPVHEANKGIAEQADRDGAIPDLPDFPPKDECDDGNVFKVKGAMYRYSVVANEFQPVVNA